MHINEITFFPEKYPTEDYYPFCLDVFHQTRSITFNPYSKLSLINAAYISGEVLKEAVLK